MKDNVEINHRYNGLDFARALLMLLVIPYHISLIYSLGDDWRVSSPDQSYTLGVLSIFLHSFRNSAFYIIAGFFCVLLIEKYGLRQLLINRACRILVPLMSVGFTLNLLMDSLSKNREFHFSLDYIISGQWLGHLWFIGNLIPYYFLAILVYRYLYAKKNPKPASVLVIAVISLLVTPVLSVLATAIGYKIYSEQFLFITFGTLYKYLPFFVLGMYWWKVRITLFRFMTLFNCAILFSVGVALYIAVEMIGYAAMGWSTFVFLSSINSAILAVSSVFILNAVGNKEIKVISNITKSSYSIYLFHYPLIVFFYLLIFEKAHLNIYLSFFLLCALVFMVTYLMHFYLIEKSTLLKLIFNGERITNKVKKLDPTGAVGNVSN